MLDKVIKTIEAHKMIEQGDSVVMALSGGPDSVAMFHALFSLSGRYGISLFALHVNHMLRGEESDNDEEYVRELCSRFGVPLHVSAIDVSRIAWERSLSIEEAGRDVRYEELEAYADRLGADKIALAHNRNDQAETVFMNILRGTGLKGLAGIEYKRGRIIRPLLDINRSEIEQYCLDNSLNPRTDSTNLENLFTRNKIRIDLIPYINKEFKVNMIDSLCRIASISSRENDLIENLAAQAYKDCLEYEETDIVKMHREKLINLHPALLHRVLRMAAEKVRGNLKGIENVHIESMACLAERGRTGACVELPGGLRAGTEYDIMSVYLQKEEQSGENFGKFEKKVNIPGITEAEAFGGVLKAEMLPKNAVLDKQELEKNKGSGYNSLVQFFDYDKIKVGINIRNRREGDYFKPLKSKGTKKLKEYFIDNKIPRRKRDEIPLICAGKEVIWIIGHKISDNYKATDNTKNVLKLEWTKKTAEF